MENYVVVSFSGGKDSTAMLLRMIELGEHIDEVVCCDTYKEFPAMYRHIDKVKAIVEAEGIKFTMLKSERSFDYYMFEYEPKRKSAQFQGKKGWSWPYSRMRWCTSRLKQQVISRYFRDLNKKYDVFQCIGIAADEKERLERKNNQNSNHRHPLVEWGWTEKDCLKYCYAKGFDWEGLYELFSRVSCWCCPLQTLEQLRKLRKHFPELWAELQDMDSRTWSEYRPGYSVADLETRFAFEEERLQRGESITSREFHAKLKERLAGEVDVLHQ